MVREMADTNNLTNIMPYINIIILNYGSILKNGRKDSSYAVEGKKIKNTR